jgi:hypothetical protein
MIFELHPPAAAGPLLIGAPGSDTLEVLKQLGVPLVLCGIGGSRPGWSVHRPSGMVISTYYDATGRVEAIQLSRPASSEDIVSYQDINIFGLPAGELLEMLRSRTAIIELEEEDGSSFLAPNLHLTLWQPPDPAGPDDIDNRFIMSIRLSNPGPDKIKPSPLIN